MDFTTINKVAGIDDYLPTKKIIELEPMKYYKITAFRTAKTKFGLKLMATINGSFVIFLPARISKFLLENTDELEMYKTALANDKLYIRFLGGLYDQCEFTSNVNNS